MKILAISTFDADGGAARAAIRLCSSLHDAGTDIRLHVLRKTTELPWVTTGSGILSRVDALARPLLDGLPLRRYRQRSGQPWSVNWLAAPALNRAVAEADLVHLHWTGFGYFPPSQMRTWGKPVVWTLHDMWPVTGGCHYAASCDRFRVACGSCPQLGSVASNDLSARSFRRKAEAVRAAGVVFISPSRWMAEQAQASGIAAGREVHVVPNGLDLKRFQPLNRAVARAAFSLPSERPIVLFGALRALDDERKGAHLLLAAIRQLEAVGWPAGAQPLYVVFGAEDRHDPALADLPLHYVGRLHDDVALALLYSAADVMVVPSLQETFGQTASEAMACATPVVAFAATGLPDVVAHGETGYLARPGDASDLAEGIRWVLSDTERREALARAARARCERLFDQGVVAQAHQDIYRQILGEGSHAV